MNKDQLEQMKHGTGLLRHLTRVAEVHQRLCMIMGSSPPNTIQRRKCMI